MRRQRLTRKQKQEKTLRIIRGIAALICILASVIFLYQDKIKFPKIPAFPVHNYVHAQERSLISPIPFEEYLQTINQTLVTPTPAPTITPTPTPTPSDPSYTQIAAEIRQVFGPYSDRAMLLLSCENSALNPDITNTNTDGSIDYGVFQINNHWQQIYNEAFLTDYAINVRLAYNIFSRDGYSFKLWTCGKKLGI